MNSFDLLDTLMARRCIEPFGWEQNLQMDEEARQFIPIRENILKVRPEDIIISDMYLPQEFLQEQFKRVTGLGNEVIVGQLIKKTGQIWQTLKEQNRMPQSHTDDMFHCLESAQKAGIQPIEARQADLTEIEKELRPIFPALAKTMREARLGTYDAEFRYFQLLQIELNFPILFLSSIVLHRRLIEGEFKRVLMSDRDCCLWKWLQVKIRNLSHGNYSVLPFYTSRVAKKNASQNYLKYVNNLLSAPSLIVDLCGTGRTVKTLIKKTDYPNTATLVITRNEPYEFFPVEEYLDSLLPSIINYNSNFEDVNSDITQMIADVDYTGSLIYWDRSPAIWKNITEIKKMHEAFYAVLVAMENYDFSTDLAVPTDIILSHLEKIYQKMLEPKELYAINQIKHLEEAEILKELRKES